MLQKRGAIDFPSVGMMTFPHPPHIRVKYSMTRRHVFCQWSSLTSTRTATRPGRTLVLMVRLRIGISVIASQELGEGERTELAYCFVEMTCRFQLTHLRLGLSFSRDSRACGAAS